MSPPLYFICGPTAIGKSEIAIRLARDISGVIINADSMQVYSNLEILTARPTEADHLLVKHKLYGHINGIERYNVFKWCNEISSIINKNFKNNQASIIVGGTGMYIHSLLDGIIDIPPIEENYKKKSDLLLNKLGLEKFIKEIREFDTESLNNISLKDISRLKRIWEVYKSTGVSYSDWKKKGNKKFLNNFSFKILLFQPPREKIYLNVNNRFTKMLKQGAIDEVKKLINLEIDNSLPIMKAHGVPEITNYLNNIYTFEECVAKGQQVTRNYVKRQTSWWRSSTLPIHQVFHQFPNEIDENLIKL